VIAIDSQTAVDSGILLPWQRHLA